MSNLANRLARAEARLGSADAVEVDDPARWDWYADSCPCGKPLGECREHPRARPSQRPPAGDWRTFLALAGRGWGKTRTGAEWVRHQIETGECRRMALVAPTAADVRDVMVEGESGIMSVCPPWFRPIYSPSTRRLTWPNGAIATTFSADEPERLRGPQADGAWLDELCAWRYPSAFDMLLLGLRLGQHPRVCITTTPKPTKLLKQIMAEPTTAMVRGSTFENRANLAPTFFDQVIAIYESTRLGQQEIYAELVETSEGAWFNKFDVARHVSVKAEYDPRIPVFVGVDAGVSRHTAAVWWQAQQIGPYTFRATVFGDYYAEGLNTEQNVAAIKRRGEELPCRGKLDVMRIDPAAAARTGVGPAAYAEFDRVFGRVLARSPSHHVADGLGQIEVLLDRGDLLLHPRAEHVKAAFQNYRRMQRAGEWLDTPADDQNPHCDVMDAFRYGVRSRWPEGFVAQPNLRTVRAGSLL